MTSRRDLLTHGARIAAMLAACGLLPLQAARAAQNAPGFNAAAFDAKTIPDMMKAFGGATPAESTDVTLTAPDIAENGAVVPIGIASTLPGVQRMLVLVEKNPAVLSAIFDVSDAVDANFSTRVKMGQTSNVYAVALTQDGKAHYARKEVKVTLGGCGG